MQNYTLLHPDPIVILVFYDFHLLTNNSLATKKAKINCFGIETGLCGKEAIKHFIGSIKRRTNEPARPFVCFQLHSTMRKNSLIPIILIERVADLMRC